MIPDELKCQQCGKCCSEEVCKIGETLFETRTPPCPGLVFTDNKYWCGVVLKASDCVPGASEFLAFALGIGRGCDPKVFMDNAIQELVF